MGKTWPALDVHVPGCDATLQDLIFAELDDFHPSAIQELDDSVKLRAFFQTAEARHSAHERLATVFGIHIIVEPVDIEDEDWAARSQSALRSVAVGRIVVSPPWDAPRAPIDSLSLLIQPSMGFGTGHHATTRLMLLALQSIDLNGLDVVDVGTGSGVLAIAAVLLGARSALGIDIDSDALANATENAALNGMTGRVRFEEYDLEQLRTPAHLVLANLTGGLILRTARQLSALVAPGGLLIVSGFMDSEPAVLTALEGLLSLQQVSQEEEWRCARFSR